MVNLGELEIQSTFGEGRYEKGSNKGKKGEFDSLLLGEILDSKEEVFKERKDRRAGFLDGVFVRRKVENQGRSK